MKEYLIDIKSILTKFNILDVSDFFLEENKIAKYAITQVILNLVELDRVLGKELLPIYLKKTRNIIAHAYEEIDFRVIWKFVNEDLDRALVKLDKETI